jgi:hypothetical protein
MPVVYIKTDQGSQITTGTGIPTHSGIAGDRYTDTATGNTYQYTTSWQSVSYSAGGLTYFTEAQNTTAPNATVPVDSLTAVSATTNADIAILPKGTGAFIVGHIPDGTIANGGKRGAGAVEIRSAESMNYYAGASGINSISIGKNTQSTQTGSVAIGLGCSATGAGAIALGNGNDVSSTGSQSTAIQGGSNASNTLSFAIQSGTASNVGSLAGYGSTASGVSSVALGGVAFEGCIASGTASFAVGQSTLADARNSIALGITSSTKGISARLCLGSHQDIAPYIKGNSQLSLSSSTITTTTNTALELITYAGTAINLVLQDNEAIRVRGSIIGKQTASTNIACYDFDCIVVRGVGVATTILPISNLNLVLDTITLGTIPTLTANTTLGGLSVKSGAKTTTTIKWSCRIDSTEVILA